jgi:hypothetical protein
LGNYVLVVGAVMGATTEILIGPEQTRWVCLEPDSSLVDEIIKKKFEQRLPPICEPRVGDVSSLGEAELFDSVLYIDVLEHIEDDRTEIASAAKHLRPDGYLIVLAPAHQFLYTPFDEAIGHFRRYSRSDLAALSNVTGLQTVRTMYLDSVGTFASLANKLLLKSPMPSKKQILFWDRFMVPLSRFFDVLTLRTIGKSVLGIWTRKKL